MRNSRQKRLSLQVEKDFGWLMFWGVIFTVLLVALVIILLLMLGKMEQDAIVTCTEAGRTLDYCRSLLY